MSTTLIVPGLNGSGPDHWQSWWQAMDRKAIRVEQNDWHTPNLEAWTRNIVEAIDCSVAPVWLVAHSFGCLAAVQATVKREEFVAGAFLVAPADPDQFALDAKLPLRPLNVPSILVASSNDPWLGLLKAGLWAQRWGSRLVSIGAAGHVNAESGFGPWVEGQLLFRDFVHAEAGLPLGDITRASSRH